MVSTCCITASFREGGGGGGGGGVVKVDTQTRVVSLRLHTIFSYYPSHLLNPVLPRVLSILLPVYCRLARERHAEAQQASVVSACY